MCNVFLWARGRQTEEPPRTAHTLATPLFAGRGQTKCRLKIVFSAAGEGCFSGNGITCTVISVPSSRISWKEIYFCLLDVHRACLATAGQRLIIPAATSCIQPDSLVVGPRGKRLSWASIRFRTFVLVLGALAISMTSQQNEMQTLADRRPHAPSGAYCYPICLRTRRQEHPGRHPVTAFLNSAFWNVRW